VPAPTPGREVGLEERLGTRWAVWVGGVALALGALLLVRYTIEQGLLGHGMRVALGAALAAALTGAGEWLRRREIKLPVDVIPAAHIPGVLTAAGTVAAFGTIYAAHALYGFIGPAAAFTLLGAVGVLALMAASLHGPALAGLGLAGSFLTPVLVSSETPNPWPLVVFLAVVAAAAYALSVLKSWRWLAMATAAGTFLWGLMLAGEATDNRAWIAPAMLHGLLQLGLPAWFLALSRTNPEGDEVRTWDVPATGILGLLAILAMTVLAANEGVSPASVTFTAVAVAILVAAALRYVPVAPAAVVAGLLVLAKLVIWPSVTGSRLDFFDPPEGASWLFSTPLNPAWFALFTAVAALAVAAVCALRLLRSPRLLDWSAGSYAGTATVLPLAALAIAYLRMTGIEPSPAFALAGLALAALFAYATLAFEAREDAVPAGATRLGTAAFAASAVAAVAMALMFALERGYLTVALAIAALATAYMADRRSIAVLRTAVVALGLIVLLRVVRDPRIMGEHLGTTPILNWLLLGYGVPAAAFYGAARVLERRASDTASRLSDALAVLFAGLLAFFQIRHLMHGGNVLAEKFDHAELGLMLIVAIGFAYALMRSGVLRDNIVFRWGSLIAGGLAAAGTVLGLLLGANPLFSDDPIASWGPVSSLALGYLLPGVAAALLARHSRETWPPLLVLAAAALALALIFAFVTLEVRHAFQGANLGFWRETSETEVWTYSAAWLALGIALLGYGLWREMPEARLASGAIVMLTVLKVFLWDMSGLEGALRAFSFLALGAVLIGIGLVYQRLIFAPKAK
jgi:uncharacterized membrane protein